MDISLSLPAVLQQKTKTEPNVMHCHSRSDSDFLMTRWMKINTWNSIKKK